MYLCRVTGTIVASRKDEELRRGKLLIVHPVDPDGEPEGERDMLAIDPGHDAGIGDFVLVAREGAVVRQILKSEDVPANVVIVGVVDDWAYDPGLD